MAKKRGSKDTPKDEPGGMFAELDPYASPLPRERKQQPSPAPSPKRDGNGSSTPPTALPGSDPFRLTPDQKAALDLTSNRVISASAGTGKTHTLTALYLGLLEGRLAPGGTLLDEDEWLEKARAGTLTPMRPGEIVAVTFTEKAAAELLERTRAALERELKRDLPDSLKEHLTRSRKELFGAPVSTIHSFCARLLREAGADGPVPAAFTVLDAEEARDLFDDALSTAAAEMLETEDFPNVQKLALEAGVFTRRSGLIDSGRSLIDALRTRGLPSSALMPRSTTSLETIRAWLLIFYDSVAAVPEKGKSKPKPELRALCAARELPETFEAARILTLKIRPLTKFAWFENSTTIENPFNRILEACHAPYAEAMAAFIERAQHNYTAAKRKAGGVDFDDLMLACKTLLGAEKVRRGHLLPTEPAVEQVGYRFVLIDEYQDTNPLQRDILMGVAFPNGNTSGIARLGVVGDIKQSIYGFRGADVTLMEEACRVFNPSPLRENFRSRKRVIDFLNELFSSVWPRDSGRFRYDDSHRLDPAGDAMRHGWDGPAGEVIVWNKNDDTKAERHRQNQAFAIARRIRSLVAPGLSRELVRPVIWDKGATAPRTSVRYGDIAILSRSLKNLRVPLQLALSYFRIPFRILKGMSFFTRPEIIDVTNLWAVACDSNDSFSLAGLLRSPFIGLSDAGLWHVSDDVLTPHASDEKTTLAEKVLNIASDLKLQAALNSDDLAALRRAARFLTHATEWRGRKTAVEILDWMLTETGFLSVQAMQPHGEVAVAAVRKAIELSRAYETRGNRHLSDFVRWMRERADTEWDDAGASGQDFSADLPVEEDEVQIGTIHSAKGLEFPIVIIADAGASSPPNNAWATFSTEHGLGLRLGFEFGGLKAVADSNHEANSEKSKSEENAERLRLLYVALTRAREYVILVGEAGTGETNWRKLIDVYRAAHPEVLVEVPANHVELKAVTPDDVAGLLEFSNGTARIRDELISPTDTTIRNDAKAYASSEALIPAQELRVSVSRLALWAWCPRRAAFAACGIEGNAPARISDDSDAPTQDGEDVLSGVAVGAQETEVDSSIDARALGTAVHAALETFFGADEPFSKETELLAAERFSRELQRANAPDDPVVKSTYDRALALVRSDWGQCILALNVEDRSVETPFRWRIDLNVRTHLTLIGQLDLIAKTAANTWQVVDYKLAALKGQSRDSESVVRYAWQAGIYARVAAQILHTPNENVTAALAFLRDESVTPQSVESLGYKKLLDGTIKDVAKQFVVASNFTNPLMLPAQLWMPDETDPHVRHFELCRVHCCPFVCRCFPLTKD